MSRRAKARLKIINGKTIWETLPWYNRSIKK
jgi:hypothetical protein